MADWSKILSRGNVDDRRGAGLAIGGGVGVVAIIASLLFSFATGAPIDIGGLLGQVQNLQQPNGNSSEFAGADDYETFSAAVLGSNNEYWKGYFQSQGKTYTEPKLVLFRTATQSACGVATSDVGPHYCPADQTIYIDETFFAQLQQLGARFRDGNGDVAQAYVIGHEVGHHVQHQLGAFDQIGDSPSNEQSIALELQADCYAGVWAHSIRDQGVFGPGEINEAVDAAAAVGDDRIQSQVNGQVSPETWTHGSSEQRVQWFNTGFDTGDPATCKTY